MSVRGPGMHMTMMYGAPSLPDEDWPQPRKEFVPLVPPATGTGTVNLWPTPEPPKRKIRITTRVEDDGELKLKVYVDGELVYEAVGEGAGTLTVETTV